MSDIEWHIEKRKISSLKDYYKNPRTLSKDQEEHLKISLSKFGLIDKPIINLDNTIIGGHQRKRTLKKMGYKEIEVNVPNRLLNEKEIEELNIRLNKNTGDFDFDVLANQWDPLELLNWGFTVDELQFDPVEQIESISEEKKEENKKKTCPACGHEFD
jgi:ParB-like chromosome segregation protein Spo0J